MTAETLKSLCADMGGYDNVMVLIFDNSITITFGPDQKFSEDMIVTIGGADYIKHKDMARGKRTKCYTTPIINIHPLECLQAVQFVTKPEDLGDVDITELTDLR